MSQHAVSYRGGDILSTPLATYKPWSIFRSDRRATTDEERGKGRIQEAFSGSGWPGGFHVCNSIQPFWIIVL